MSNGVIYLKLKGDKYMAGKVAFSVELLETLFETNFHILPKSLTLMVNIKVWAVDGETDRISPFVMLTRSFINDACLFSDDVGKFLLSFIPHHKAVLYLTLIEQE